MAAEDIINLAKLISTIYDCFCPEQYDNELNIEAHRIVTALEIDQQLKENGDSGKFVVMVADGIEKILKLYQIINISKFH